MNNLKKLSNKLIPILFFLILIGIWQGVVMVLDVEKYIMPSPTNVISAIIKDFNNIMPHVWITLYEGLIGFLISIVLALILSIIMDFVPFIKKGLYPLLVISQTVPVIALAPLFIIWFGFGILPKIIVVILVCFFPIVIAISDGLENIDKDLINHYKLMGASRFQVFFNLKLPYGLIGFFSGVRIAATYSIMGAVIGEWLGGDKGLGVYMTRARSSYALDKMFGAIVFIVLLSILIFYVVGLIEKLLTPWRRKE